MAGASGIIIYTYAAADRLTGDSAHPGQFQYDNRGNLRYDGNRIYQYDGANRLARVDLSEIVTYTWDQALELPQVLATSNNEHYLYGHNRIGIERDGVWSYPLPDALGSVRQRSNSQGNVTGLATYDPFGSLIQREGAYDRFGFTGEMNGAFGLQYLRARWYDPATGRFTQVDPFPGLLSLPGTQQPYIYGLNNPLRYTDPSGEFVHILGGAAAGAVWPATRTWGRRKSVSSAPRFLRPGRPRAGPDARRDAPDAPERAGVSSDSQGLAHHRGFGRHGRNLDASSG